MKLNVTWQQIHSPRPAVEAKESGALLTGRGGLKPPSAAEAERSDSQFIFDTCSLLKCLKCGGCFFFFFEIVLKGFYCEERARTPVGGAQVGSTGGGWASCWTRGPGEARPLVSHKKSATLEAFSNVMPTLVHPARLLFI